MLAPEQENSLQKFQESFNRILLQVEGMGIGSLERKCFDAKENFDSFMTSVDMPADLLRIPNIYSQG